VEGEVSPTSRPGASHVVLPVTPPGAIPAASSARSPLSGRSSPRSELDGSRSGPPQRPLLITAQHHSGQPPATSIRKRRDQPRTKVVRDKHHASISPRDSLRQIRRLKSASERRDAAYPCAVRWCPAVASGVHSLSQSLAGRMELTFNRVPVRRG